MNAEQLKSLLIEQGWKFGNPLGDTGVSWYAYRRLIGANDCECSDKPPSLCITPYYTEFDGRGFESAEFSVRGETTESLWVDLKVYGVKFDDVLPKEELIKGMLLGAWNLVHSAK